MFAAILILFILPWLDTSKVRSARFRPVYKMLFWAFLIDCLVLGYVGGNPPEGVFIVFGRLATALYFLFFLTLPLIGWFEQPKALPNSIATAVLENSKDNGDVNNVVAKTEDRV